MESIVAIFILLVSVVTPMAVVARALFAAYYAQDQITAVYLSQEGVELARNVRDNNVLNGTAWNQGALGNAVSSVCYSASGCSIDARNNTVTECSGACPYVQEYTGESDVSWYGSGVGSWQNTKYIRTVKITKISGNGSGDYQIKINATVTWDTRGISRVVTTDDVLTNWP